MYVIGAAGNDPRSEAAAVKKKAIIHCGGFILHAIVATLPPASQIKWRKDSHPSSAVASRMH